MPREHIAQNQFRLKSFPNAREKCLLNAFLKWIQEFAFNFVYGF